jgi:hypothetical protein
MTDSSRQRKQTSSTFLLLADKKMFAQQGHLNRKISLVVLSTSLMVHLEPSFPLVVAAVQRTVPGSFESVEIPEHPEVQTYR